MVFLICGGSKKETTERPKEAHYESLNETKRNRDHSKQKEQLERQRQKQRQKQRERDRDRERERERETHTHTHIRDWLSQSTVSAREPENQKIWHPHSISHTISHQSMVAMRTNHHHQALQRQSFAGAGLWPFLPVLSAAPCAGSEGGYSLAGLH